MVLKLYPNICKVEGNYNEIKWIRELLTIDVPGAKYTKIYKQHRWDGKKRLFSWGNKSFPIGLVDYVVRNGNDKVKLDIQDFREFPKIDMSLPEMNIELRDYQKQAILDCLKYKNCIVQAATNAGKTVIFAGVIKKIYPNPTIILIHRGEVLTQIKEMVESNTGLKVGIITAKDVLIKPVTVAMVQTLLNRIGADQEITDFYESAKCVIVDEVHHNSANSHQTLLSSSRAVYRFGFSGTVPDEDTFKGMMTRCWIGSVVFNISNDALISMGVSAKPKIFISDIDSEDKLIGVFNDAKEELQKISLTYTSAVLMKKVYELVMRKAIIHNDERNGRILEIAKSNTNKSILIVVDILDHGRLLEDLLNQNGVNAVFISGDSEIRESALELFKLGKIKVLISTNIIDEGVDISRIEVLVMAAGKKSKRQLLQRVGRSLRRKEGENVVKIFDFADYGNKYIENHSRERLDIYKKEGFEIEFI